MGNMGGVQISFRPKIVQYEKQSKKFTSFCRLGGGKIDFRSKPSKLKIEAKKIIMRISLKFHFFLPLKQLSDFTPPNDSHILNQWVEA